MGKFLGKFEKTLGIAGSIISLAGLGYNFWKSFSKIELNPKQIYSLPELSKILGISQEEAAKLIYENKIPSQQVGGKYKILGSSILSFLGE